GPINRGGAGRVDSDRSADWPSGLFVEDVCGVGLSVHVATERAMKTLERRLGLGSVIAISINAMIGSGLFVLPGIAVSQTGSSVWLAYLTAGLCVLPAALCKAELATAMPESGGTYIYIDRAFGPILGTITGLGLW